MTARLLYREDRKESITMQILRFSREIQNEKTIYN